MNSLIILLWDEFRGFIKSKIMIALWVGLPILTLLMHFIQPDTEGMPFSLFTGIIVASIGGLLSAVMLSATMVNELDKNVYDLYLIRPVKRWHIIIAKYLAVLVALVFASIISFTIGLAIDSINHNIPTQTAIIEALKSLAISTAAMSISCAAGILIGIIVKNVALSVILSIYFGQQLSVAAMLPAIFIESISPVLFSTFVGVGLTAIILIIGAIVFNKKQF
jgi:ABC-2 type transport system permease protein